MTPHPTTRDIAKSFYRTYLQRADECLRAAEHSFSLNEWNATAINAIHACIAACDAMCVYFLGKRCIGESHNETVVLFKTIRTGEDITINANRIARIMRIKNMAEYEERLISRSDCERIMHDCEKLVAYVKKELPCSEK